ncbi:MAG: hypothetical protein DMF79_14195 [Acidobacteria bacterium]|nr:MAG: hypothetical protein DMF79_14195 [Acidobacteriota bacterium]
MPTPQTESTFIQDVRKYLVLLQRRRALIATCLGVSLLIATLYNYTARPIYQGTVQILIDKLMDGANADFQTEYQLLRGRILLERVVGKLDLQKSLELQTGPTISPWERFQLKFLGKVPPPPVDADGIPMPPAVAAVRSRLTVEPLPGGRLVNLRFNAYTPQLAARVANTIAETYIEQSVNLRYTTTSAATEFLSDQMRDQKHKLETAEGALAEFKKKHGLVGLDEKEGVASDKIQALEAAAMNARMQRIAKETIYSQPRRPATPPSRTPARSSRTCRPSRRGSRNPSETSTRTWSGSARTCGPRRRGCATRARTSCGDSRTSTSSPPTRRRPSPRTWRAPSGSPSTPTAWSRSTGCCVARWTAAASSSRAS